MSSSVKVDDLTLQQIDILVARLEGLYEVSSHGGFAVKVGDDNLVRLTTGSGRTFPFSPSTDWRQGGPIIERNDISIEFTSKGWRAHLAGNCSAAGSTLLEAAMRTRIKMTHGETAHGD